ncbi:MAG: phosphoribosylformylglycinamidine cyclo-ligase, partial [Gammaproteobacteria bacterium]|nr:phosphoribosylformylglycinamidine cyclo-ligase [Gammaproteobacteria bacterium]
AWTVPPVFQALLAWSGMDHAEAYRVFNMGMGMVAVIPAAHLAVARTAVPDAMPMGALITRRGDAAQVELA